jgi:hypothetical protein
MRSSRQLLLLLSAGLFLLCLTQPAVDFERVCHSYDLTPAKVAGLWQEPLGPIETFSGFSLLINGAFGLALSPLGAIGWFANLFYFSAFDMSLKSNHTLARQLAFASLLFGIISLPLTNLSPITMDEGGVCGLSAISPNVGYWLWLAAMAALNVVVWIAPRSQRSQ